MRRLIDFTLAVSLLCGLAYGLAQCFGWVAVWLALTTTGVVLITHLSLSKVCMPHD